MCNEIKPSLRNFRLMILGQIISILGSALLRFALSLYVLDITKSETAFAALFAISNIPLLLAPLGGVIADRFNRRNLMVIFDFTSGGIILCFFFLLAALNNSVVLIGAVMVLLATISALYTPAVSSSIPLLVDENKLAGANGIVQAVQALSGVAAPVLGGVLYGTMGVRLLVVISFAAFFLSAVMEIFIQIPFEKRKYDGHIVPAIITDMKDGFAYVWNESFIRKFAGLAALLNLVIIPCIIIAAPLVLRVTMNACDTVYGTGMGLIQFACIVGALSAGVFSKWMRINTLWRWIAVMALLFVPAALSVTKTVLEIGFWPPFILFMFCMIVMAAAATILSVYVITRIQAKTPNANLGKVMAIITAAAQCAAPLGQFLYGAVFDSFSGTEYLPLLLAGGISLIIAFLGKAILTNEYQ